MKETRLLQKHIRVSHSPSTFGWGRGFSNLESDADRLTTDSSDNDDERSIAITGRNTSLAREDVRSRSFCIDLRTEPKPANGEDELGEETAKDELGVLGPKGKSERRLRKAGIPEPAGVGGENPIPCCGIWLLLKTGILDVDCLREELENMSELIDHGHNQKTVDWIYLGTF